MQAMASFMEIERRREEKLERDRNVTRRTNRQGESGSMELKRLQSSINYGSMRRGGKKGGEVEINI